MGFIGKVCVISAACLIGFGCGEKEEDEAAKSELEGTWNKACGTDDGADDEEKEYDVSVLKFTGTTVENTATNYSDANCTTSTMSFKFTGTVAIGDAVTTPAGAKAIDITAGTVSVTVLSDEYVGFFNSTENGGKAICGGGWVKGTEKVITKELCAGSQGFGDIFEPQFTIFKIDGSNLYFGDSEGAADGKTAATRHNTLETRASVKG